MNPLLQQKCVFCRDGRLPKHKKRQTKPDLLISSVFSKHHPPMNNFFVLKKPFAIFDQFLNKTWIAYDSKKVFVQRKKAPKHKTAYQIWCFAIVFENIVQTRPPRTKTLLLNFAKNNKFLQKNLNHSRRQIFTWFKTVVNITSLFAFSTRTRRHTNYLATLVIWKHIQNDVLRVNEVISQELQIWVVHSLFAAGVTSARRTTMSSTSSSSSACRLRAEDRDGQWHARSSIALSAATQPQTHIALHTRRNLPHRFGLHEHPVKRLFDEFRVLGAAHAHGANKDIKLGADISCAEQLRGRWHSLAQDAYFKGQPHVEGGHFRGRGAHVSVRHVYAALQTPVQSTDMQKVHRWAHTLIPYSTSRV